MGLPLEFIVFSNIITDIRLFFFPLQIYLYFHVGKMKKGKKIRTFFYSSSSILMGYIIDKSKA